MRGADERYFERLEAGLDEAFAVANAARERGGDPTPEVEIPVAQDMADRVENILGIDGVAERVRELEGEMSREEAALELVSDFVEGSVGDYESRAGKIEGAVRTAVALLTEGVVAAPIEGIDRVELLENDDGTEFINVYYAGPIRSAGGTAQALSVLVADYARALLDIDEYNARQEEVGRYAEEVELYDGETGLQYAPAEKEARFIAEHMPIMLDGEATGDEEVEGYRDLERVDTNAARGGMCLVLGEGIALKAPKIQRYTRDLEAVSWPWLQDLIDGTYTSGESEADGDNTGSEGDGADDAGAAAGSAAETRDDSEGPPRAAPSKKYLQDLIAGRPVFSHPSESGGFRLRYGRARNHGHATAGVHPATMRLVDDFLAPGTQIKTERPGKAAGVVPVDTIEGPTVRLANGDVRRIDDADEALELRNGVERILDLGEYLVNYGEFVENNHRLVPASYVTEWWETEFEAAGGPVQALRDSVEVDLADPTPSEALSWAREYDAPLHPAYTYLWHDVSVAAAIEVARAVDDGEVAAAIELARAVDDAEVAAADGAARTGDVAGTAGDDHLVLPRTERVRETLETLLVEHTQDEDRLAVPVWRPLVRTLGFDDDLDRSWTAADVTEAARSYADGGNAIRLVEEVAPFSVRERAPTRVGNRMGRPEKSEERELSPAVHTLFPIGDAGGSQRDVDKAAQAGDSVDGTEGKLADVEVGRRECVDCGAGTYWPRCPDCGGVAEAVYVCPDCDREVDPDESGRAECPHCEIVARPTQYTTIDVKRELRDAKERVGERASAYDVLKGVKGLSSKEKTPEPLEKGVLRAKHDVSAFKDGTVRYDMTDLPVTAVRPEELGVTVEQFRELGYHEDVDGDPLRHDDQLVELKVQDVVLSDGAAEHLLKTAEFVDDLLSQYYGLDPYYEFDDRDDLVGELVFGMAPHTSAATVGRVIGFTSAAVGYAHPYFHAAKRRNCFHPETTIQYEEGGEKRQCSIETFVEERLEEPRTDDFGTRIQDLDGSVRVPSLADDSTRALASVEAVSKHPAPDHLVRIDTSGERSIIVTPDHSMLRWDDGPVSVRAHELAEGDPIPVAEDDHAVAVSAQAAADGGRPHIETVERIQYVPSDVEYTYCLTVEGTHRLVANGYHVAQCDGDEDCVMLLLDGLLNFSRTYLPDQRGGSVAEDSRLVAIDPEGNVRFMTFAEFWTELDAPLEVDGKFRKRTCIDEGWQTYAFDETHRATAQPIEKAIRYRADENERLLRVETQFGRSLTITEDHSLFRYEDGIEDVAGADLSEGDLVLAPRELAVETHETTIDVTSCFDDPYVVIDDHVEDLLTTAWETTAHGSPTHQAFRSGLAYRLERSKIGYDRFEEILDCSGFETPDDVTIGLRGFEDGIQKTIELDEDFAWLLGLFVAKGTLSSVCPAIHNSDEELVGEAVERGERVLGFEPRTRWSNGTYEVRFPAVFREVLYELGFERSDEYNSSETVVPECVLTAPREVVVEFLRGFVAGDGSDKADDNVTTVAFHTASDDVKDGIVFLLHRLGLVGNVSERAGRDGDRQGIYTVTVSGGTEDNPLHRILDGEEPYRPAVAAEKLDEIRPLVDGDLSYLRVENVERVDYDGYLYDLQVGGEPIFTANWLYAHNSMDAPLVMSSRIDPTEIDDEAHNVDIMEEYPREFYEATREMAEPGDVEDVMTIAEETLGTDREYTGFRHTHDTTDIAAGPDLSAYKTLGSMEEKMDAQLSLSRKLRAVDETDVAERIIEYHFLPDLLGNLKAFASQEVRCLGCGEKYRRAPLSGECRHCGGDVTLTVHEGSVNKYMDTAIRVAEEFGARPYTKQRLQILDRRIERIFEDDTNKQSGIADFM